MSIKWVCTAGLAAVTAGVLACGGSAAPTPMPPTPTPPTNGCTPSPNPNTIVIQNNQVCPQRLTIARGSQVTMVNNDGRAHEMDSDPHPEHNQCPELNQIDYLNPGQSRSSGNLNTVRTCGFHDHIAPDNAAMKGTITIQ
jgi:plastocyanin